MAATPTSQSLDPFPDGWYLIGPSDDIRAGKLIEKTWMGEQIIVWRGVDGAVCVADAFCPHLGAHLGPSTGGKLSDGNLVCPFHGFEYDTTGRCVATPTAPPPRTARLTCYESKEAAGFVFAYHGRSGDGASWQLPDFASARYFRATRRLRFRGHPQTTSENSVDRSHLGHVHGYAKLQQTTPTEVDGPVLSSAYSFTRPMLSRGLGWVTISVDISIRVWGLGISTVEIKSEGGLLARQWVLATPVDGELIDLWLAVDIKQLPPHWWFKGVVAWIGYRLAPYLFVNELVREVLKDAEIWARQRYRAQPVLAAPDRDIVRFRRYAEQFYAPSTDVPMRSSGSG